jgi:hypothetical protein
MNLLDLLERFEIIARAEIARMNDQIHFLELIEDLLGDRAGMSIRDDAYSHHTI